MNSCSDEPMRIIESAFSFKFQLTCLLAQPVQDWNIATLFCLAILDQRYKHAIIGPCCSASEAEAGVVTEPTSL